MSGLKLWLKESVSKMAQLRDESAAVNDQKKEPDAASPQQLGSTTQPRSAIAVPQDEAALLAPDTPPDSNSFMFCLYTTLTDECFKLDARRSAAVIVP